MSISWDTEPNLHRLREAHDLLAKDPMRALSELQALADQGSVMSMVYLGYAYKNGIGVGVDPSKALAWYEHAARSGSVLGLYGLGLMSLDMKQYQKAKESFKAAVALEHPPSMNMLGKMYYTGLGCKKNIQTAKDLYQRSAALGHVFAKRNLAILLMRGKFGLSKILPGVALFLLSLKEGFAVSYSDEFSDRLR